MSDCHSLANDVSADESRRAKTFKGKMREVEIACLTMPFSVLRARHRVKQS
jgi:hypothetical protein